MHSASIQILTKMDIKKTYDMRVRTKCRFGKGTDAKFCYRKSFVKRPAQLWAGHTQVFV